MLIDILDILGNVTGRLIRVYHEDPFKAVWASTMMQYSVLLTNHNKIKGKEEGITTVDDFRDEDCWVVELNLMPTSILSRLAFMRCVPTLTSSLERPKASRHMHIQQPWEAVLEFQAARGPSGRCQRREGVQRAAHVD